ncbi:EamA family transporter, partial [Staphylococcus epidermidis]
PVYIIFWFMIRGKATLKIFDLIAVTLTLTGTFLLLTNGSLSRLVVPTSSITWGVISCIALAFYTIYATKLLVKFSSI